MPIRAGWRSAASRWAALAPTIWPASTRAGSAPSAAIPPPSGRRIRRQASILIGEGLTNRQIGERMFLAEKTVKNYVSALFAKLGMERRTQAAAYAVRVFDEHDGAGHGGSLADEGP
jgi:DNA-binding NarL/FixJ family response regulator